MTTETHWRESGSSPPLDDAARTLPVDALPEFIGTLAKASAIATLRLHTPTAPTVEPESDRLLTAEEASARCGLTPAQLLRKRDFPARRKVGPKTVRFSARAIERYLKRGAA